ncbi:MAG: alpha/beta hydrolase [Bacteroidetes bacterium]|nr:alpha/beta hydrolase [Bacteroidota bacterium]
MKKVAAILILLLSLLSCYSQKTQLHSSNHQDIEEKFLMNLGGSKQYVEITGKSSENPILLFIHGGPGWPQTPQLRYFNADLAKKIILVTWDQRGCGRSYLNDSAAENLSLDQIVSDAHELTQFLKVKYKKSKIYVAGYSWGSIVGLSLIQKYSEDYIAYIGISQVINLNQGMAITQSWLTKKAMKQKDTVTLQTLDKLKKGDSGVCKNPLECFMSQYELLSKYHGAVFNSNSDKETEKAMTKYDDYKNYDWNKGFLYSAVRLEKDMFSTDFSNLAKIKIPVYFIEGRHDWNVPAVLVDKFVKQLNAPKKEIIWFESSGHGPLEEEPLKFNRTIIDIVSK